MRVCDESMQFSVTRSDAATALCTSSISVSVRLPCAVGTHSRHELDPYAAHVTRWWLLQHPALKDLLTAGGTPAGRQSVAKRRRTSDRKACPPPGTAAAARTVADSQAEVHHSPVEDTCTRTQSMLSLS